MNDLPSRTFFYTIQQEGRRRKQRLSLNSKIRSILSSQIIGI